MLLIFEALLLISAAPLKDHRAEIEGQIYPLDMALNSADDLYYGCRKESNHLVMSRYLKEELNNQNNFKKAWENAKRNVTSKWKSKLKKEHKIALFVYTDPYSRIYSTFNTDTRNGRQNYRTYKWHSLHFFLTDAILILKEESQKACYDTFRGTKDTVDGNVNTEVRFGSFTSSSVDKGKAQRFGKESCFEIHTCEAANVTKYSRLPHEKEVLIPPYETFKVIAVKTKNTEKDLWCNTVFVLKSTGIKSDLNCGLIKKL